MLKNDLYHIINLKQEAGSITVTVQLNVGHAIFGGHFPGQPVVPGACLMQMVKEVTEDALHRKLTLSKASMLKFIHPVDPHQTALLDTQITYESLNDQQVKISAVISAGDVICLKMQAVFKNCY